MLYEILAFLSGLIIAMISRLGYSGIIIAMAIESACIPLPSEVIMPFSGYLVARGRFNLWYVSLSGALGCTIGSLVAYWAGALGGRPFLLKYGKYFLISAHEIEVADRWFQRWGDKATFISRLLPVIRTFISLPAGIARMNFTKFIIYAFLGSLPWSFVLAYAGMKLGENWDKVGGVLHKLDFLIVAVIIAGVVFFVWKHLPSRNKQYDI